MKPLSESIEGLATRVKQLEDSATATFEADRLALEQRSREIDAEAAADFAQFEADVHQAHVAGRNWWAETRAALARPFEELRVRHEQRKAEHEIERAKHMANVAEEDAAEAVAAATYALNVAEYAVIDASLARMAADDLAGEPTGHQDKAKAVTS